MLLVMPKPSAATDKKSDKELVPVKQQPIVFPPQGYQPTPLNALLANALDLTAPASAVLLKNRKNAWVQLAGHPGSFAPASGSTIWKRQPGREVSESRVYKSLVFESVSQVMPRLYREVEYNGNIFIEIEDLLQHFHEPNIMDIKMGTRTFLESEVSNPKLRSDLFDKLMKVDSSLATDQEKQQRAVTKLRYMQCREQCSSSALLGFRIEAIRLAGQPPNNDLKNVCTRSQVMDTLQLFVNGKKIVCERLITRLIEIRTKFEASKYFKHHELIGSSLLVLCDHNDCAGVWMIDFAKTQLIPDLTLSHRDTWRPGNHEDGYLTGLDNLIDVVGELLRRHTTDHVTSSSSSSSSSSCLSSRHCSTTPSSHV